MQTIAICDMRSEDSDAQSMFWEKINDVMLKNGHEPADFYGFMADEAHANWKAIRQVFNNGIPLEGRERSCLFHWTDSLNKHTIKYVVQGFEEEHKKLCTQWRCAKSEEDATNLFRKIRGWWASRKVADANIPYMECWLSWWHVRYPHWRKHFTKVS